TLAAGQSLSVHVTGATTFADVSSTTFTGTLPNTATVTATNEAPALQGQKAGATITVVAPGVTVSKAADQSTINAGQTAGFPVTIKNVGATPATGVALSAALPAGLGSDVVWAIDTAVGNPGSFQIANGALALNGVTTLSAGQSLSVHITGATTFA